MNPIRVGVAPALTIRMTVTGDQDFAIAEIQRERNRLWIANTESREYELSNGNRFIRNNGGNSRNNNR